MGQVRNTHKFLVGKPEGKIQRRYARHRWEDHIRMDPK